jgi:MFS family permease
VKKRQISVLFLCSLVPWTIGNGISPLLPVQAAGLGATQAVAGCLLSLSYLAMAAGTVTGGWLSDRFHRRKVPALVAGLASIPALWRMGQATTLWSLAVALAAWFFCAGLTMALISIAAGLCAEGRERGKVFGLLALTAELGALFGGGLAGPIANRWGYTSTPGKSQWQCIQSCRCSASWGPWPGCSGRKGVWKLPQASRRPRREKKLAWARAFTSCSWPAWGPQSPALCSFWAARLS